MTHIPLTGWGELDGVAPIMVCDARMAGRYLTPVMRGAMVMDAIVHRPGGGFAGQYRILAGAVLDSGAVMSQATLIVLAPAYDWATSRVVFLLINLTNSGYQLVRQLQKLNSQSPSAKVLVGWDGRRRRHSVCYSPSARAENDALARANWPDVRQTISALSAIAFSDIESVAQANDKVRAALAEEQRRAAKRAELRARGIFLREPCFPATKALPPMVTYVELWPPACSTTPEFVVPTTAPSATTAPRL